MPVFRLPDALIFPDPSLAEPDGLLAVGGDLSLPRLRLAYANGIFPWYSEGEPILWWSPPVRPVLHPAEIHISRSIVRAVRRQPYRITLDAAFERVIDACARVPRRGQRGTWITRAMQRAYCAWHGAGEAHSAEAWDGDQLVGGLYGVALGGVFFGESMFAAAPDASKIAFVMLCRQLAAWEFGLIDCQVTNEHTARFGTVDVPRAEFIARAQELVTRPARVGRWEFDAEAFESGLY